MVWARQHILYLLQIHLKAEKQKVFYIPSENTPNFVEGPATSVFNADAHLPLL